MKSLIVLSLSLLSTSAFAANYLAYRCVDTKDGAPIARVFQTVVANERLYSPQYLILLKDLTIPGVATVPANIAMNPIDFRDYVGGTPQCGGEMLHVVDMYDIENKKPKSLVYECYEVDYDTVVSDKITTLANLKCEFEGITNTIR